LSQYKCSAWSLPGLPSASTQERNSDMVSINILAQFHINFTGLP